MKTNKVNKILLWLDDVRNPFYDNWILKYAPEFIDDNNTFGEIHWVKNYDEFTCWIETNGLPDKIAFDHDLEPDVIIGNVTNLKECKVEYGKTGMDCAKWLINYCLDTNSNLPEWVIQSYNPVGKDNINKLLNNFKNRKAQ